MSKARVMLYVNLKTVEVECKQQLDSEMVKAAIHAGVNAEDVAYEFEADSDCTEFCESCGSAETYDEMQHDCEHVPLCESCMRCLVGEG